MRIRSFISLLLLLLALPVWGAETIPPSPSPLYIVDDAHVLSPPVAQSINQQLEQVERDTSNQIVVGIYAKMQSDDDIAAYAVKVFQSWHIGQKGKDNGVLLLVFTQDRKMNITTGYGLEGALPDATAKMIIEDEIKPHFKNNDYNGGIQAGVNAILAATRGEYKGTGHTRLNSKSLFPAILFGFFGLLFFASILRGIYGTSYSSSGRVPSWVIPFILLSNMTSTRSSGGWSGGGGGSWGGGGGGGFSGGGGSSGGGGASGSW